MERLIFPELKAPSSLLPIFVSSIFLSGAATAAQYTERLIGSWLGRKTILRSVYSHLLDLSFMSKLLDLVSNAIKRFLWSGVSFM
jgi:hypothetical protein